SGTRRKDQGRLGYRQFDLGCIPELVGHTESPRALKQAECLFSLGVASSSPRPAIIFAPRARFTLRMSGSSSGLSPTASAIENSNVSIAGRPRNVWATKTSNTIDQHCRGQEISKLPNASIEFRLRRCSFSTAPADDRPFSFE